MVYQVTAYPYATQNGWIDVPPFIPEENVQEYIENHFSEIEFDPPELDYNGTDFDIERDEMADPIEEYEGVIA